MKKLLLFILLPIFLNASYNVYFYEMKLGNIKTFDTLKDNYVLGDITNGFARWLAGKDKICLYNDDFKGSFENIKMKKDSRHILKALDFAIDYPKHQIKYKKIVISDDRYMILKCDKNCTFTTIKKGEENHKGSIIFKNNAFYSIYSDDKAVEIRRD